MRRQLRNPTQRGGFAPDPTRTQVWSNGGGTQSTAIAALIIQGVLPKPDLAVMVDTEREKRHTFEYFEAYTRPALDAVGVHVHVVRKSEYATVDLTSKNGSHILLPLFTTQGDSVGKLPNYCSGEWKRDVILRWLRSKGVQKCDQWIGISMDEFTRATQSKRKWARKVFPLIDLWMTRRHCREIVAAMGWPEPPRSSCWMCPNMSDAEWRDMKDNQPDDFERAVHLERELRGSDPHIYFHQSCVPLDAVDFTDDDGLFSASGRCSSGYCFT